MADRLKGKFALVTGAAHGIGEGCAARFAAEGATVIGIDVTAGVHVTHICNLTDEAEVARLMAEIYAEHGKIDILINAAAFATFNWIEELSYAA